LKVHFTPAVSAEQSSCCAGQQPENELKNIDRDVSHCQFFPEEADIFKGDSSII
jgi:hypothetical protein